MNCEVNQGRLYPTQTHLFESVRFTKCIAGGLDFGVGALKHLFLLCVFQARICHRLNVIVSQVL